MDLVEQMQAASTEKQDPFLIVNLYFLNLQMYTNNKFLSKVLDRAERLRDMPPTVIPALLKLREMSGMNVSVILISDLLWDRYYHGKMRFCKPTISIFFSQYNKSKY